MSEREAFEAWVLGLDRGHSVSRYDKWEHYYHDDCVQFAWLAWQAARADALREAAKVCVEWGDKHVAKWQHDSEMSEYAKSHAWTALQCAAAIRALLTEGK